VRTGESAAIALRQGKTSIEAAANTQLEIPAPAVRGNTVERVIQSKGNAFYDVAKRDAKKLRVETPYLVAVVKGTQFNVAVLDDSATISLFEGRLEIHSSDETDVVTLEPGQIATRRGGDIRIRVLRMDTGLPVAREGERSTAGPPVADNASPASRPAGAVDVSDRTSVAGDVRATTSELSPTPSALDPRLEVQTAGANVTTDRNVAVNVGAPGVGVDVNAGVGMNAGVGNAGAAVSANVGASVGSVANVDLGASANVGASGASVATNTAASLGGAASTTVGTNTAVDLGAGSVSTGAAANVGVGSTGASLSTGTSANLGTGSVATGTTATVDLAGTTTSVTTTASTNLGTGSVGSTNVAATVSTPVTDVSAGATVSPTTGVSAGATVGAVNANLGVNLGTGAVNVDLGLGNNGTSTTTSSTPTTTPAPSGDGTSTGGATTPGNVVNNITNGLKGLLGGRRQ
jgi:hypothetical protein